MNHGVRTGVIALALPIAFAATGYGNPIVVTPSNNAMALAMALLAGSSGITINSATYTGYSTGSGTFTGGSGVLGFDTGIVLTTGQAGFIVGPNNSPSTTFEAGTPGDAALSAIVGATTYDAAILEINFTPTGNQVAFSYQFGSEEYNEYVGTQYNDVFAFFVNGVNRALIPGTSTPVTINNVNCGANSAWYQNNTTAITGCPNAGLNTQLDGLTRVLTLTSLVNPGVSNILRLAIADTSDMRYDSAVMLQGGSFTVCGGPNQPPCPPAPEPMTFGLLGSGIVALVATRARRRK